MENIDLVVPTLGEPKFDSPLGLSTVSGDCIADYTDEQDRLPLDPIVAPTGPGFELAGPRQHTFFEGTKVTAGIVTCGGLCPGMNNVIRGIVKTMWGSYGCQRILGFRYGYRGLASNSPDAPLELTPDKVRDIHLKGGTLLGSSRGGQDVGEMVDTLVAKNVQILFAIGGDGTLRGANAIYQEVKKRGLDIAIVGVPKTIDNDIPLVERTFGFDTAVSNAATAIRAAHVEATGAPRGLGIVRLMGRHSGFIAASATLAARVVDLVLIPELAFDLDGPQGVIAYLRQQIARRGHCVVVIAEGAGQRHLEESRTSTAKDASGNHRLGDIGVFLRDRFASDLGIEELTIKYIDPSYIIRAAAANDADAIYCGTLAQNAAHAAMAGKTGMLVGLWFNQSTHVPLSATAQGRKSVDLDNPFWRSVIDVTGQPSLMVA